MKKSYRRGNRVALFDFDLLEVKVDAVISIIEEGVPDQGLLGGGGRETFDFTREKKSAMN